MAHWARLVGRRVGPGVARRPRVMAFLSSAPTPPPVDEAAEMAAAEARVKAMLDWHQQTVTPSHIAEIPDDDDDLEVLPEDPTEVTTFDGMPDIHRGRTVVIAQKTKSAMTSSIHNTKAWCLTWKTDDRWSNPLMGWTSTSDPLSNHEIRFDTAEQAVRFAKKSGWKYELEEPFSRPYTPGQNKYSHNFLSKGAEHELEVNGMKTKLWDFQKPNSSHYFRPLTYHGDDESRQHGLDPHAPWKD
eukprot:CAMPEP_0197429326 /NCGR_PEP_ID=MMETSP1170-20131217/43561_1 /TAXON_ID=54406 /ORGANISM="Sarcinochrysis sp, Strain CCMP770" /LENGTH=242 /DNA_ID=CAMNT_0042957153 /DNA_START=12 /DNA_END=740 /DNA_ORIENTATION=-